MTSTIQDHTSAYEAARTPSYDGPGAIEIQRRLRALQSFCEFASNSVGVRDVERALAATRRARVELEEIEAALGRARPAEILDEIAVEKRRIAPDWQPDATRGGDPLVDVAQADPVVVSANDLIDFARGCRVLTGGRTPDGALRAAVHVARQQPHRAEDFWVAFGDHWPEVRRAIAQAGALPDTPPTS